MGGVIKSLNEMNNNYQEKVVLFLDIIDFKSIINNKKCHEIINILDKAHNEAIKQNHEVIDLQKDENGKLSINFENGMLKRSKLLGDDFSYVFFSDSIIISFNSKELIQNFFQYCAYFQYEMLLNKIMIRGGISFGNFFCEENKVFGPSLVEAYDIESKEIKFPFIGVREDFFNKVPESKIFKKDYFELSNSDGKDGKNYEVYLFKFLDFGKSMLGTNFSDKLVEIREILEFLKLNNDKERTPKLIKYIENFIQIHSKKK